MTDRRLPQLDALRGLAILLVVGLAHQPIPRLPRLGRLGMAGVDLFFVLSGTLVGGLLIAERRRTGRIAVGRFLARRAWKIWPSYYLCLAVTAAVVLAGGGPAAAIGPYLVHLQNYFDTLPTTAGHFWSLAVEEHFYVALPLILALRWPRWAGRPAVLGAALLALGVACAAGRWQAGGGVPCLPTHLRIDELALGVYLAAATEGRAVRRPAALALIGVLVAAPAIAGPLGPLGEALTPTLLGIGSAALIWAARSARVDWTENPPMRWLAAIGRASYSIYLWHILIVFWPARIVGMRWLGSDVGWVGWVAFALVYVATAVAFGAWMTRLVERPILAIRERLLPRRARTIANGLRVHTGC